MNCRESTVFLLFDQSVNGFVVITVRPGVRRGCDAPEQKFQASNDSIAVERGANRYISMSDIIQIITWSHKPYITQSFLVIFDYAQHVLNTGTGQLMGMYEQHDCSNTPFVPHRSCKNAWSLNSRCLGPALSSKMQRFMSHRNPKLPVIKKKQINNQAPTLAVVAPAPAGISPFSILSRSLVASGLSGLL
jgi:hypothetical protein